MNRFKSIAAAVSLVMASSLQAEGLVTYKALTPDLAVKLAQATLKSCQDAGYQVAVVVTDRFGLPQALIRDRFAGAHTPEIATRKAWTAASFNTDTLEMVDATAAGEAQSGVRFASQAMMVGGGVRVQVGGSLVGAVGVSGAPGGAEDHKCAVEGIAASEEDLAFL
jgi:uncharacterized protein GlcG (DUF336 family)